MLVHAPPLRHGANIVHGSIVMMTIGGGKYSCTVTPPSDSVISVALIAHTDPMALADAGTSCVDRSVVFHVCDVTAMLDGDIVTSDEEQFVVNTS